MYKLLKANIHTKTRLYSDPYRDSHSISENFPFWQGTVVAVDINLDRREEFSLLLELIREAYSKSVKERKKEIFKKAKFI